MVYIPPELRTNGTNDDNLCCKCNAPNWRPRHECKNKNLFLCAKNDNDDNNNEEVGDISPSEKESDSDESNTKEVIITPTLSVAARKGISQPQTLKMFVYIKNTKVTILADSGTTHNFIEFKVEKK